MSVQEQVISDLTDLRDHMRDEIKRLKGVTNELIRTVEVQESVIEDRDRQLHNTDRVISVIDVSETIHKHLMIKDINQTGEGWIVEVSDN